MNWGVSIVRKGPISVANFEPEIRFIGYIQLDREQRRPSRCYRSLF